MKTLENKINMFGNGLEQPDFPGCTGLHKTMKVKHTHKRVTSPIVENFTAQTEIIFQKEPALAKVA